MTEINPALPIAEYIERKFDAFVLALQPIASQKYTRELPNEREYFIKLTPDKIQDWCQVAKKDLLLLSTLELVAKYTGIKHEKEREYGM